MRINYFVVLQSLTEIILKSKNIEECVEEEGLKRKIRNFEFILLILIFSKLLQSVIYVSKLLQSDSCDMMEAKYFIENSFNEVRHTRENYENYNELRNDAVT